MDFPKKQAQRLMPLYLLEYSEKLFTNHPNPEDPWGGGSDYTAGQGITITNNEISVDTNVVATKSDIAQMVTTTQLNDALDDYALKTEIPTDVSQLYNDAGYATETWVESKGYVTSSEIPTNYVTLDTEQTITGLKTIGQTSGTISEVDFSGFTFKLSNKAINHPEADIKIRNGSYDGYQHPIISSSKGLYVNLAKIRLGDDGNNTYGITMPDSSTWESDRILATTSDIPSLDGYATQTWVQEQGYSTFSGSYNDLTDKPNLLPIRNAWEEFTFTETGTHVPPYKWGENMACTSTWICYGSVEALPQIYLKYWFSLDECYAYPQYMWQDENGYHAVYSTELVQDNTGASGGRIVLNAPSLGATWTSVSTYPVYGKDKVNNATITFTQGGVNKGSFTVNQSSNQTIALDASGSTYTAGTGINITNDTISVDDTVALKSEVPSTATSTSTSTVTPTTIELVFTYEDNTTQTITLMTGATVSTSTTTTLS